MRKTNARSKAAAAVLAIGFTVGGVAMAAPANAVTSGTYCGATQQYAGDVYAQACLVVSGYSVYPSIHVTNHGNHTVTGTTWINHLGAYEDYATCSGMTASDPGAWCNAGWDWIGSNGYAQAQGSLVIDGVSYGKVFSPSEYIN
ncbi:hypothetical protein ACIPLC_26560 [Kitasatospora sp. NPDC086801]|uniref:hypothetical protein n=1 Tax=Kitasatospora sp. NPDC086801 TaxID=3364066 RepID=UPI0038196EBB